MPQLTFRSLVALAESKGLIFERGRSRTYEITCNSQGTTEVCKTLLESYYAIIYW